MIAFILYCLKVAGCSAVFAGYYFCFLRRGNFYRWNRFYLLAATMLSLLIPLFHIPVSTSQMASALSFSTMIEPITIYAESEPAQTIVIPITKIAAGIYLFIAMILLGIMTKICVKMLLFMRHTPQQKWGHIRLYEVNDARAPFSFFNLIFWKAAIPLDTADGQCILQHELVHIRERHSVDKLFMQAVCTVFWINPFFWLLRHELQLVHEFIADQKSITEHNTKQLSALILYSLYPQHYLNFINPFFQSPIKTRLTMLSNTKKTNFIFLRKVLALPLVVVLLCVYTFSYAKNSEATQESVQNVEKQTETVTEPEEEIFLVNEVTVPPSFIGGDSLLNWLFYNLRYPKEAFEKEIEGRVTVSFIVSSEGKIKNIEIGKSGCSLLDEEAIRVINQMPDWNPGTLAGQPVSVQYILPIIFKLDKKSSAKTITIMDPQKIVRMNCNGTQVTPV